MLVPGAFRFAQGAAEDAAKNGCATERFGKRCIDTVARRQADGVAKCEAVATSGDSGPALGRYKPTSVGVKPMLRTQELFGADGQDFGAADFDFDAEGRTNIAALHDGATNPDIAGKAKHF
jgi:hypothetical protein